MICEQCKGIDPTFDYVTGQRIEYKHSENIDRSAIEGCEGCLSLYDILLRYKSLTNSSSGPEPTNEIIISTVRGEVCVDVKGYVCWQVYLEQFACRGLLALILHYC